MMLIRISQAYRERTFGRARLSAGLLAALLLISAGNVHGLAQQNTADDAQTPADTTPADDAGKGDEEVTFPKIEEMQVPDAEELLNGEPKDWIVLKNGDVIVCEPIVPRPDTLAVRQAEIKQKMDERRGKSGEELERLNDEIEQLYSLVITIPEFTENPEFRLELRRIDHIIHHEDLMLQRIDALLTDGEVSVSLELLTRLEHQWPKWPGLDARHNRLLFVDAGQRQQAGHMHEALVLLTELYGRQPDFPELSQRMGEVVDAIITAAIAAGDYRQARYFLLQLAGRYKDHPVYQKHATQMLARSEQLLQEASDLQRAGRHAESAATAEEAASLWPRTPNVLSRIRPFVERYQRLHVGVVDLPDVSSAAPYPDRAGQRLHGLTDRPLFELDRVRSGTTFYRTRYFDEWEPFDLGRRLDFTLSQVRQPWDARPILDGPGFAATLKNRLDPESPQYDERLDYYVESVRVVSPVEVAITFDRVPARAEPLLSSLLPDSRSGVPSVAAGQAGSGEALPAASTSPVSLSEDAGDEVVAMAGFQPIGVADDQLVYRRGIAEPDGLSQYHVAEVVEHHYGSHEKALQALRQGEVSMLPDLPDWILRRVQQDEDFPKNYFVQRYALPRTHIVQINPHSVPLHNGELRRGLIYALDRESILRQTVLRDPQARHGRVVASPFPSSSFANSIGVLPREYNLSSAVALVLAAAQQLEGGIPPLKMLVPPGPVERAAASELQRAWKRVGVDVQLVKYSESDGDDWDLVYRTMQMTEPTVELWPFLTAADRARIGDLTPYPDWLKQELVSLDRTSDWNRTVNLIQELHKDLWSEALFIPLWEVDEFLVIRKNIGGFPLRPIHCYQNVEHWTVEAWYAPE